MDRTQGQRPLRWEDDFSRHALDDSPFDNCAPINTLTPDTAHHIGTPHSPLAQIPGDLWDMVARDHFPLPGGEDREGYSRDNDEWFWLSGLRDYLTAQALLSEHGRPVDRLLEIGASTGRVSRHFAIQAALSEVWVSDLNHRSMRWQAEHMPPNILPLTVPSLPGLPIPDSYLDAVTAWSVFTHIDTFETAHLAELRRVLRPGGIALLTAHTEETWAGLADEATKAHRMIEIIRQNEPEADFTQPLRKGRSAYRHSQIGPYRGLVFHSTCHIHQVWGRFFEVVEVLPRAHAAQTIVVLRKPESAG